MRLKWLIAHQIKRSKFHPSFLCFSCKHLFLVTLVLRMQGAQLLLCLSKLLLNCFRGMTMAFGHALQSGDFCRCRIQRVLQAGHCRCET